MHKFGWLPNGKDEERYEYPNVWAREKTTGPDRLIIAPRSNQIQFLEKLASKLAAPYLLLYVLVVTRGRTNPGRYQSEFELSHEDLRNFLNEYAIFLENDGRHHLWVFSPSDSATLVYDNHNVIYAYGPLERLAGLLKEDGLEEIDKVMFPYPHHHHYNPAFDDQEEKIAEALPWLVSPLRDGDR